MAKRQWKPVMPRDLLELWVFVFLSAFFGNLAFLPILGLLVLAGVDFYPYRWGLVGVATIAGSWGLAQLNWR